MLQNTKIPVIDLSCYKARSKHWEDCLSHQISMQKSWLFLCSKPWSSWSISSFNFQKLTKVFQLTNRTKERNQDGELRQSLERLLWSRKRKNQWNCWLPLSYLSWKIAGRKSPKSHQQNSSSWQKSLPETSPRTPERYWNVADRNEPFGRNTHGGFRRVSGPKKRLLHVIFL